MAAGDDHGRAGSEFLKMTLAELIDLYRTLADDRASPPFASDADITVWLNEAQREATFRARLLVDTSVSISITAAKSDYGVGSNGLWIRWAKLDLQTVPITPLDYRDLDRSKHGWRTQTGTPTNYITGLDTIGQPLKLRLHPIPIVSDKARIFVVRHPLADLAIDGDIPEIELRWHEELVHWALYRGFQRPDADFVDTDKALNYYGRFEAVFGSREAAIVAETALERQRANRMTYAIGVF